MSVLIGTLWPGLLAWGAISPNITDVPTRTTTCSGRSTQRVRPAAEFGAR